MNPPQKNQESDKLGSRSAHITAKAEGTPGTPRKWILYLVGASDPLLGFVHASTKAEALDRVARFGRRVIAVPADADAPATLKPMTPERISRLYALFGSVIPADSAERGRNRTPYFYRCQAIAWAKMAREWWPSPTFAPLAARLAKDYLATYRRMKSPAL